MTLDTSALEAVKEQNLSYLVLAKDLLRKDREMGMFRLGLSAEMADLVEKMTVQQVVRLADCGQLLCQFRVSAPNILKALADKTTGLNLERTQAATLLAGEPASHIA